MSGEREDGEWRLNYFSYFTEVEEHFQRARGTGLFLMSPLDWALVESWKNSGIPMEAVLRGIDASLTKWKARKQRSQMVNSLAYCTQAVVKEAEAMANNLPPAEAGGGAPFSQEAVRSHIEKAIAALKRLERFSEVAQHLQQLLDGLDGLYGDLQELELRLTSLEDKMAALARTLLSEEQLLEMRRELDRELRPYRSKMTSEQLARLEKSFLDRKVYEISHLPRLSLFYL